MFNRHRGPEDWWSNNATVEDWFDEMVGQANIINRFAGVRMEDIRGIVIKDPPRNSCIPSVKIVLM